MSRCLSCGASSVGELIPTIQMMYACNNCRVDVAMNGQWTGYAMEILTALAKRYGKETVMQTWDAQATIKQESEAK